MNSQDFYNSTIKNLLAKDWVRNISVLGFFENYPLLEVYREGDTLILLGESDHLWAHISSESPQELTGIFDKNTINTKYYSSVEKWMKPIICRKDELEWELSTIRYYLSENQRIEGPNTTVQKLNPAYSEYIFQQSNYKSFTSIEYIEERLSRGVSAGIIHEGKLIAWGLNHDDGALGFLHVLPDYRGKGYAEQITKSLILQRRKENKPVFLNIEPDNIRSVKIAQKHGFVADREIGWIKLV